MQIFLTTLNPGTYTFPDLGGYTVVHPIGPIPLIEPNGEFTPEDIVISNDLIVEVQAGNIELTNEGGDQLTSVADLQTSDQGLFVSLTETEQIAGQKSFTTGLDVIGTTDYELVISNDDDIPNKKYVDDAIATVGGGGGSVTAQWKFSSSTSTGPSNGEFRLNNSSFGSVTQLYISEETETGADFSTIFGALDNGTRLFIQQIENASRYVVLDIDGPGTDNGNWWSFPVTVEDNGTNFEDGKECAVLFFSSGEAFTEVNDLTSNVTWDIVPDAFISQSSVTQHEGAIDHDALTNFVANEHIDWTVDQGATNINNANIEFGFDNLSDGDTTTNAPLTGSLLYFNGTDWVPTAFGGAADEILFLSDGCVAEFIDTTGLDFCNTQIGPSAGSAFYIAKRALGTIDTPLPVTDQLKIGGYSFLAFDGVTSGPGYVGAEISSTAQGDQNGTNGGANLWFSVTEQGTKIETLALEIEDDGTLSVAAQTDYELKVLDDDDIPNKKYVDDTLNDALVPQDLPTVRVRQTVSLNPIPTTWTDFDWDTQDEENNTAVIEYTGTPADEIDIKEAGLYLISWGVSADDECDIRITNNGVVVPGSFHSTGDKTDSNQNLHGNSKTIAATLAVGTLVMQIQATTTAEFTITDSCTLSVTRLSGPIGPAGPAGADGTIGADGADGPPGFGVFAWADVVGTTGALTDGLGLTVVRNAAGSYTYSFTDNPPTASYAVFVQGYDVALDDFNTFVSNRTTGGFDVDMGVGDNGATPDVPGDADHTVIVVRSTGLPAGSNTINVNSDGTPATNTPHGTLNFSTAFTVTDAGSGVVNIGSAAVEKPFAILKIKSAVGDQAANYNTATAEIALVLTGTSTSLGTAGADFTNNNGSVTCNFTGSVKLSYGIPHTSTGARASLKSVTQIDTGGGFTNVGAASYAYIRNSSGHQRDDNKGEEVFTCNTGDIFRVGMRRSESATSGTAINILENTFIQIERLS